MSTKTERITILGTPDFKAFLNAEAANEGLSVSELVRKRCKNNTSSKNEELLIELIGEAKQAAKKARLSLGKGIKDVETMFTDFKRKRK